MLPTGPLMIEHRLIERMVALAKAEADRASMEYFTEAERDGMLAEFHEFDRGMIHERYQKTVERFEGREP